MNGHAWSELGAASMDPFGNLLIARYAPFGSYIVAAEKIPAAKLRMSKVRSIDSSRIGTRTKKQVAAREKIGSDINPGTCPGGRILVAKL